MCVYLLSPLAHSKSQRRFLFWRVYGSRILWYILVSGFHEWSLPVQSVFPRADFTVPRRLRCRPGGEVHARRKQGGRENRPSWRETGCMNSHPCRAHHKLKWARKKQSIFKLLYKNLPRSESSKTISAQSSAVSQTPTGQPCPTVVGNSSSTIRPASAKVVA